MRQDIFVQPCVAGNSALVASNLSELHNIEVRALIKPFRVERCSATFILLRVPAELQGSPQKAFGPCIPPHDEDTSIQATSKSIQLVNRIARSTLQFFSAPF